MKKILLLLAFFFTAKFCSAQNAYYEAQFLTKIDAKILQKILDGVQVEHNYYKAGKRELKIDTVEISLSDIEKQQVKNLISFYGNPFGNLEKIDMEIVRSAIDKYNQEVLHLSTMGEESKVNFIGTGGPVLMSLLPMLGAGKVSLSAEQQTNLIDGVTKYYAEEFKKARVLTYMQVFNGTVGKVGELQVLFPETYKKLSNTDPARFPDFGDEYKDVFEKDLHQMLPHLVKHIEEYKDTSKKDDRMKILSEKNNAQIKTLDYYPGIVVFSDIADKMINNYPSSDLFNYLDEKYYTWKDSGSFKKQLAVITHTVNLLQFNLRDTSENEVWIIMPT